MKKKDKGCQKAAVEQQELFPPFVFCQQRVVKDGLILRTELGSSEHQKYGKGQDHSSQALNCDSQYLEASIRQCLGLAVNHGKVTPHSYIPGR